MTKVPPKCHQNQKGNEKLRALRVKLLIYKRVLVALPGLEPGLFALRGRRVNQLHHNAMNGWGTRCDLLIIAKVGWVEKPWVRFLTAEYWWSWGRNTGVSPLRPAASGRDDGVGR